MIWNRLSRLRSSIRSSLWAVPLVAIPLELLSTRVLHGIDGWLGWTILGFGTAGAQATLQAIVTATLSFVVFTFGSLLVAIQVASAQLTSRIIATTLLRDDVVKYTVGLFIFTLLFSLSAQNRIDTEVNELVLFVAMLLGIACFAGFFYLIDHASRLLRPISILGLVCNRGLAVIRDVYPDLSRGPDRFDEPYRPPGPPSRVVLHRGNSAIVLAIDLPALLAGVKRSSNAVIEFVPQIGDFVAADEPLFHVYDVCDVTDDALRATVAFGSERTLEQDPTFSFRIIVDIALRALSAAINDPTTGVLAIDQLHRLLRLVGMRHLRSENVFELKRLHAGYREDPELGGLCQSGVQRNPKVRIKQLANRAASARNDFEFDSHPAGSSS